MRVILVRHAEAESGGPNPPLTAAGRARAQCLVDALREERVTHVFTSPWRRTVDTLAPLAAARKIEAVERDAMEARALADEVAALPAGSVAVVAGHSNTLPLLAKALGGELTDLVEEGGQPALRRDEHDRLVVLRLSARGDAPRTLLGLDERRYGCPQPAPER